jgi:hypothetical protein
MQTQNNGSGIARILKGGGFLKKSWFFTVNFSFFPKEGSFAYPDDAHEWL